jgi:hypothetical protein
MPPSSITQQRLLRQRIAGRKFATPAEVVAWLGAMQAQDYLASLWAIGLRTRAATQAAAEQAIAERKIVRTWPMRGTLHWVAAEDVRWMSALMTPRVIAGSAARLQREHGLDDAVLARCRKIVVESLQGGQALTRGALYAALDAAGIATAQQRGIHITGRLAQEGLLCLGPRADKQPTFVLLEEWVTRHRAPARDEALAELAQRYFRSRGPATAHDFAWWSGLTLKDAQLGIELAGPELRQDNIEGKTYLLSGEAPAVVDDAGDAQLQPSFDEYLVAYKDRSATLEARFNRRVIGVNGLFNACVVVDGRVVGTWKRTLGKNFVAIALVPFRRLLKKEHAAVKAAAQRYGNFIGLPVRVSQAAA